MIMIYIIYSTTSTASL